MPNWSDESFAFVKASLRTQISMAERVANHLHERVYVYDSTGFSADAEPNLVLNMRTVVDATGQRALLSTAAQSAITSADHYLHWAATPNLRVDANGVYVEPLHD